MKLQLIALGFCLGGASALMTAGMLAQDRQDAPPQDADEMARVMELWQAVATPGENHARLNVLVGEWDADIKVWMGGAGGPAMESEGRSTSTWVLDGRFIRTEFEGSMMGMPYSGIGYTGYDNYKHKFVSSWMDSMGTALLTSEGLLDQTGDVLSFFGTMDEWMTDEHDKPVKYVYRFQDDNTHVFELHDLGIVPGETKVMEITYRRRD